VDLNISRFADSVRRRMWLLRTALEDFSVDEALALAKKAEAFLTERAGVSQKGAGAHSPIVHQLSARIH
jgi:hypothetical protein